MRASVKLIEVEDLKRCARRGILSVGQVEVFPDAWAFPIVLGFAGLSLILATVLVQKHRAQLRRHVGGHGLI
jgi:hypothetical protein